MAKKYKKPTLRVIKNMLKGLGGKVNLYGPWNKTKGGQVTYFVVWNKT